MKRVFTAKKFSIFARKILLTYSQVPNDWSLQSVKLALIDSMLFCSENDQKLKAWLISEEQHRDGGKHFHCLLEGKKKLRILNAAHLDIEGVHGNYQPVKDLWLTINYVKKGGKWIGEGFPGMNREQEQVLGASYLDAKLQLYPDMSVEQKLKLRDEMATLKQRETITREIVLSAPVYAFQEALLPLIQQGKFQLNGRPMGLVMHGEAHSGKTTMSHRVAQALNKQLAVYREPREMFHYTDEQVILFDEMTKERFEANRDFLSVLVTEPQAKTESYYGNKQLGWPRFVLLATNEQAEHWEWDESTRARFIVVQCSKDNTYTLKRFSEGKLVEITDQQLKELMQ